MCFKSSKERTDFNLFALQDYELMLSTAVEKWNEVK